MLEIADPQTCKSIIKKKEYKHPDAVFGVAWNPREENFFITGCKDCKVRMFDINSFEQVPVKTFSGHLERVYNVLFNPNLSNLIASGSDDNTIRIWDTNKD